MDRYKEWYKLSLELKILKEKEAALRRELCAEQFNGLVGSFKAVYDTVAYEVTCTSRITRSLDKTVYMAIEDELSDLEKECVKHTPSLVATAYKHLPEDSLLHSAVTEKPAMPTMKLTWKA